MNVKYIGIKTPAFAGFIALLAVFSGYCRMDFNQNDWLRQQVKLRHHPSPSFQLTENSLHNKLFSIQQDVKVHLVAGICMDYTEALTLAEADTTEENEQLHTTYNQHAALVRQKTIQSFIANPLIYDRETIPLNLLSAYNPKPFYNKVLLKTLKPETHG